MKKDKLVVFVDFLLDNIFDIATISVALYLVFGAKLRNKVEKLA